MEQKEKARQYSEDNSGSIVKDVIQKIYLDGYKDGYVVGYEAGLENRPSETEDTEFVDLGLPSGTLWSKDYLRNEEGNLIFLNYGDAMKYNLPTYEQWDELKKKSLVLIRKDEDGNVNNSVCHGINSESIVFELTGYYDIEDRDFCCMDEIIFILTGTDESVNVRCANCYHLSGDDIKISTYDFFKGHKFPVRLVKNKS